MNRRKFIQNASLSLAAISLSQSGNALGYLNGKSKKNITAGFHVWVYAKTLPGYDVSPALKQIFSDVSYAGFDGVEMMPEPLRKAEYTKQMGELKEQFKIALIGSSYGAELWDKDKHNQIYEDVNLVMSNLASLGGRTFGTSVGRPKGRVKTDEEFDAQVLLLKKMMALGKEKGITVNLHNHTYEVENNLFDLRNTLKRLPEIKLGPDLNWLLRAGVNPVNFLKEFKTQINFLHLRDQLSNGKWPESMGEGNVDFKEIGSVLKEINFDGDAVIELAHENDFKPTRPLRESLKMSRAFMKKTMGI